MRKAIILFLSLNIFLIANSQILKRVNVSIPGNLSSTLTSAEKTKITDLTITGLLDSRDFKCLRDEMTALVNLDINSVTIKAYSGSGGTHNQIVNYPESELPLYSFSNGDYGKKTLKSVLLPTSIDSIGDYAFYDCTELSGELSLGNKISSIGRLAFCHCTSLSGSLKLPNSLVFLGNNAFANCYKLSGDLIIPDLVSFISDAAFYGCFGFDGDLIIGDAVKYIDNAAFSNCYGLKGSLKFGNSVKSIGSEAFFACSNLSRIMTTAQIPPQVITSITFYGINKSTCVLEVSPGTKSVYKSTSFWNEFLNIVETTTDLQYSDYREIDLKTYNGKLIIENIKVGDRIIIYDILGTKLKDQFIESNIAEIALLKGVYFVCVDKFAKKVIVR